MNIILAAAFAAVTTASTAPTATPAGSHGCLNNSRLLSHAAYVASTALPARACGHLLSTDRVVTSHAWNRT